MRMTPLVLLELFLLVSLPATAQTVSTNALPAGAKVFIAPIEGGFNDYLKAAQGLCDDMRITCNESQVHYHLAAQGIEFALKSFLRAKGVTPSDLSARIGHSLLDALQEWLRNHAVSPHRPSHPVNVRGQTNVESQTPSGPKPSGPPKPPAKSDTAWISPRLDGEDGAR